MLIKQIQHPAIPVTQLRGLPMVATSLKHDTLGKDSCVAQRSKGLGQLFQENMFKEIPINPVNCNHNGGSLDKLLRGIPEHPHITVLFTLHLEAARTTNSPKL